MEKYNCFEKLYKKYGDRYRSYWPTSISVLDRIDWARKNINYYGQAYVKDIETDLDFLVDLSKVLKEYYEQSKLTNVEENKNE